MDNANWLHWDQILDMKIITILVSVFLFCFSCTDSKLTVDKDFDLLMKRVVETVEENHVEPRQLSDSLSISMFEYFMEDVDAKQLLFTQKDIQELSKYKSKLDDELKAGDHSFFADVLKVYSSALKRAKKLMTQVLDEPIDLNSKEILEKEFSMGAFAKDELALKDRWRKFYKKQLLEAYFLLNPESELSSTIDKEQLRSAKEMASKLINRTYERYAERKYQDFESDFVISYLEQHDLQTYFMTPEEKEIYDSNVTRKLKGIGIYYTIDKSLYPIVAEVYYGGPAWDSNQVEIGDIILKVGDRPDAMQDIVGFMGGEFQDKLIGEIGTSVTIQLKKKNGQIENVTLVRREVTLPLAYSFALQEDGKKHQVGYINLPRFYYGDEGSAYHMLTHIRRMNKENISSLIIDLRDNKGGSASEARMITSYFLDDGPIEHRQLNSGEVTTDNDQDGEAEYRGDLVVMCNARSSSASEYFAGNMKDYNRGLIVGSPATYGKGSAQGFYSLTRDSTEEAEILGHLKLTHARFFTGSGRSPQYTGIESHIVLPDKYLLIEFGERVYKNVKAPISLDIENVTQDVSNVENLNDLVAKSKARVDENIHFQAAYENAKYLKVLESEKSLPLHFEAFRQRVDLQRQQEIKQEEILSTPQNMEIEYLFELTADKKPYNDHLKSKLSHDPYVLECMRILEDMATS